MRITEEQRKKIIEAYKYGKMSTSEIAEYTKVSKKTVRNYLTKEGLKARCNRKLGESMIKLLLRASSKNTRNTRDGRIHIKIPKEKFRKLLR